MKMVNFGSEGNTREMLSGIPASCVELGEIAESYRVSAGPHVLQANGDGVGNGRPKDC